MTVFSVILLFQTSTLLNFFNDFISSSQVVVGTSVIDSLFSNYSYFLCGGVILISLVIFVLMSFKEKPRIYYSLNMIGYILLIVLYIYTCNTINGMQENMLDERLIRAVRDFLNIEFIFQLYSILVSIIRSVGLDIKKFDFKDDLDDLDLNELDNEEFEVNVEFDSHTFKRKVRRSFYNARYYFVENKIMLLLITSLFLIIGGFILYRGLKDDTVEYSMNQEFSVTNYNLKIEDAYLTSYDISSKKISDDTSLIAIKFKIKTFNKTENFIFGKLALKIGDNKYYHNIDNKGYVNDLGSVYTGQKLTDEYQTFILVYEIPKNLNKEKMDLIYTEEIVKGIFKTKTNDTRISLGVIDLDEKKEDVYINYNQSFIGSGLLEEYEIKFNNIELDKNFKINYKVCVTTNECYDYYEYLSPTLTGISDKALLRINMDLTIPENGLIKSVEDLIIKYGFVEYEVDGVKKNSNIIKVINTIHKDKYKYFEIKNEILNANKVDLVLKVRNDILRFKIK